jgi:hypothetical protein
MKVEPFRLVLNFFLAVLIGSAGHYLRLPVTAALLLAVGGAVVISRLATIR